MNRDPLVSALQDLVDHTLDEFEARLRADVLLLSLSSESRRRPYGWKPGRPMPTRADLTAELRHAMKGLVAQACALNEYSRKNGIPHQQ